MAKSFVLVFLALGIIFVEISSAKSFSKNDDDSSDEGSSDENDSDDEFEEKEENPAFSCLLFGDKGCHVGCHITSQLFKRKAHGDCDSNQVCCCHSYGDESFHTTWERLFDAEYVYRKIMDDDPVSEHTMRIFSNPFRTAEGFKESLYPIISPYQFSQLEINDKHSIVKYTKEGKFDKEALQKYVEEKLKIYLKSKSGKSLLNSKYKEKFRKALEDSEESKATLYNFTFRVNQLENKMLENVLEEYLKKKKIEKPKIEIPIKHDDIHTIIDTLVFNELTKQIEEKGKDSPKKPSAVAKKPKSTKKSAAGAKKSE